MPTFPASELTPGDLGERVAFYDANGNVILAGHLTSLSASQFMGKCDRVTVSVKNGDQHTTTAVLMETPTNYAPTLADFVA